MEPIVEFVDTWVLPKKIVGKMKVTTKSGTKLYPYKLESREMFRILSSHARSLYGVENLVTPVERTFNNPEDFS